MTHETPLILIIDDDKATQEYIYDGLTEEGYTCDTASCADDALGKLHERTFDVALVDIILPGISGIELLNIMESQHQNTPAVMISGIEDIDTIVKSINSGAFDYILKPFTIPKLTKSINMVLVSRLSQDKSEINLNPSEFKIRKSNIDSLLNEMDAIAYGVDAQVDYFDFHSRRVIQKTIELAYYLGIPEEKINLWTSVRDELLIERDERIKTMQKKLMRNPMAQILMHVTKSITNIPGHNDEHN